jgi:hypothetical protein
MNADDTDWRAEGRLAFAILYICIVVVKGFVGGIFGWRRMKESHAEAQRMEMDGLH